MIFPENNKLSCILFVDFDSARSSQIPCIKLAYFESFKSSVKKNPSHIASFVEHPVHSILKA